MKALVLGAVVGLSGAAVQAQDWSGAYGVLGASKNSGEWVEFIAGSFNAERDMLGNQTSLGLGYNMQSGAWVFGGEIAFSNNKITFDTLDPTTTYLDGLVDLKGRVGYATGKLLWYGVLGWSSADEYFIAPQVTNEPVKAEGMSIGLGVEMLMGEHMIVGLEVLQRNLKIDQGEIGGFPILSYDHNLETIGLRVGFKF